MKLHEWIYQLVCDVCYDKEYLYASYVRHFGGLMDTIYHLGKVQNSGAYVITGMKSNRSVYLHWSLDRRIDMVGLNCVHLKSCIKENAAQEEVESGARTFELSSGEELLNR